MNTTTAILVLASLCFASLSVAGRIAFAELHIPPDAVVSARMLGGCIAFFLWARAQRSIVRVERKDLGLLVGCAILGVVLNQLLFLHGLEHLDKLTAATSATLLTTTIPVFVAVFAVALGRERFHVTRTLGIVIALGGALTLIDFGRLSLSSSNIVGNVMILGNCTSYALFLVLCRPLSAKYSPLHLAGMLFLVGFICTAPLGAMAWIDFAPHFSFKAALVLGFIIAVPTVGAYALTQMGLRRTESSEVAAYAYLQPVFATIAAVFLLRERPGPKIAIAAALIFVGLWVTTRSARASSRGRRGLDAG